MKVAIVYNHPYDKSFCHAILETIHKALIHAKHEVDIINLDKEKFNPVMSMEDLRAFVDREPIDKQSLEYKKRIEKCDHLIFIFPIWWELMPALTKGFIDKVIFPGIAYDYENNNGTRMKKLFTKLNGITVISTMNTPKIAYRLIFGNAIKKALLRGTFWKIGYKNRKWISINMVKFISESKRKKHLDSLYKRFSSAKF
ncbi:MAG: NAD(P)H-dependent oxidoreductase [Marinifilaceae bacterium]|jgi:putative NADPH-quinone reductase|nr:NAD(P)H-dependent oxidoreductase [Marinifilaceae bacterium]